MISRFWRFTSIFLSSAVTLGGCTNYPAVGSLSASMNKSVESWRLYTNDYSGTCKRQQSYVSSFGGSAASCETAIAVERGTDGVIEVLLDYFGALSAVATDSNYDIGPGIDAIASAASDDLKLDAAKTAAISGLAKFLSSMVVAGAREKSVKELIVQADNASVAVDAVSDIVGNYATNLEREAKQFETSYGPVGMGAGVSVPKCEGASVVGAPFSVANTSPAQLLYQEYYVGRCNDILKRRAAVGAYKATAEAVKKSLLDLQSSKAKLKTKEIAVILFRQAEDLNKKTKALKKAFASEKQNV